MLIDYERLVRAITERNCTIDEENLISIQCDIINCVYGLAIEIHISIWAIFFIIIK